MHHPRPEMDDISLLGLGIFSFRMVLVGGFINKLLCSNDQENRQSNN